MERMLDNEGCRIWSTVNGTGLPVILINGGAGCDDYLWDVSAMIEDFCEVVRFEPRGCGRSDYDGNYSFETMVSDIDFVRESYGFEKATLIGHSFGPDIGLAYVIDHPERATGLVGIAGGRIVDDRQWHAIYDKGRSDPGEQYPKEFIADPRVN